LRSKSPTGVSLQRQNIIMTATPAFLAQSQQYLLAAEQQQPSLAGTFAFGKQVNLVAETLGLAATLSCFGLTALMMGLAM